MPNGRAPGASAASRPPGRHAARPCAGSRGSRIGNRASERDTDGVSFEPSPPGLRASDADREAVVERLHRAATEGRLDADELEERISAAYAAKYCRDLDPLVLDVTPPRPVAARPMFVARRRRTNGLAIA